MVDRYYLHQKQERQAFERHFEARELEYLHRWMEGQILEELYKRSKNVAYNLTATGTLRERERNTYQDATRQSIRENFTKEYGDIL